MDITTLFCEIDDFCKEFLPEKTPQLTNNKLGDKKTRNRKNIMSISELMTIVILFHESGYRTFKAFYTKHVMINLNLMFPTLLSYNRFVSIKPKTISKRQKIPLIVKQRSSL